MIRNILENHGIKDFNCDRDKNRLATLLKDDSLLFKKILRLVLHHKLERFFNKQISYSNRVEDLIPRASRPILIYQLKGNLNIDFPKVTLSKKRIIIILLIYAVSFVCITGVYISIGELSIFPYFFLYLALMITIPALILGLISLFIPRFFAKLDWDNIIIVEDLLHRLIIDNYSFFSENNYSHTIDEIDEICPSEEHLENSWKVDGSF